MHRRLILSALASWPAASLLAQEGAPRPRHKIGAAQLHEALSGRFPVRFMLAGLLEVAISAPRLLLLSARDKLGAGLVVQVGGMQLQPMPPGEIDVVFALRSSGSPSGCASAPSTARASAALPWASWCRSTAARTPGSRSAPPSAA